MRVILADDHSLFRQGLRALLEAKDSTVEVVGEAADGLEVTDLVAETLPDVIVMDILMPKLNGLETTRLLQERFPGVKVIILSSYGEKAYVKKALKNGAWGFVLKDAVFEELVVALHAAKNNKRYITPGVLEPILTHYIDTPPLNKDIKAYESLTNREQEIFKLLTKNCSRKEIAVCLGVSIKTIDTHCLNILHKLDLGSDSEILSFMAKLKQEEEV